MITLAIDTSEARGSVALRRSGRVVGLRKHESAEDYSSWLLPAVKEVLGEAGTKMEHLDLLGVSTGPGSFTGLRVGLTVVKAWAEVYEKRIVGVSRLEAMAARVNDEPGYVAACYDAQRGQMFGGLYRSNKEGKLERVEEEMVVTAGGFLEWVGKQAGAEAVKWVSLDPELMTGLEGWRGRAARGDAMVKCGADLAGTICEIAEERAGRGEFSDVLMLDANYVRRSDAEIFWKGPAGHAR